MPRFRYRIGSSAGRWHDTKREAMLAAVKAGHGSVEEYQPYPGDPPPPIYLHPLVAIEEGPDA